MNYEITNQKVDFKMDVIPAKAGIQNILTKTGSPIETLGDDNRGFTFVETLLTVVIIGIIASVAAKVLLSGLDVYAFVVNRNNAFQTARSAMDRMEDEILLFNSTSLTWLGSNRMSLIDSDGNASSFKSQTASLGRRSVPCIYRGGDFLAGDVVSLNFSYKGLNGAATIWSWLVRRIDVDFTVQALTTAAGTVRVRETIFPRNFMYSNFQ